MKRIIFSLMLPAFLSLAGAAQAQNAAAPAGTWKWTVEFNDQSIEQTLTLKLEAGQLTGAMSGRNGTSWPISEATYSNGDVAFKVVREFNGNSFTTTYKGKVAGDTITGTTAFTFGDEERSMEWTAKRQPS